LIQAGILVLGIIVVVVNLLVDLLYRVLNPRVALN
jgi:ABC-type dipeptide/oligopeptide/nickel transport system permease component